MLARALAGVHLVAHHAAGGAAVLVRLAVGVVQHLEREQLHRAPAGAAGRGDRGGRPLRAVLRDHAAGQEERGRHRDLPRGRDARERQRRPRTCWRAERRRTRMRTRAREGGRVPSSAAHRCGRGVEVDPPRHSASPPRRRPTGKRHLGSQLWTVAAKARRRRAVAQSACWLVRRFPPVLSVAAVGGWLASRLFDSLRCRRTACRRALLRFPPFRQLRTSARQWV